MQLGHFGVAKHRHQIGGMHILQILHLVGGTEVFLPVIENILLLSRQWCLTEVQVNGVIK
jgi:hypothetical protein